MEDDGRGEKEDDEYRKVRQAVDCCSCVEGREEGAMGGDFE